jgi:hypothetical protein
VTDEVEWVEDRGCVEVIVCCSECYVDEPASQLA